MKKTDKKPKSSKNLQVTCRFIEQADVRAVATVHSEAFGVDINRALDSVKEHATDSKTDGAVVALVGKTIVGYALFTVRNQDMYIANVGVRKRSRGHGVCGVMIPWLLRRLACFEADSASLFVVSETDAAIRCYKSHGFVGEDESSLTYRPKRKRPCPTTNAVTYTCVDGSCH